MASSGALNLRSKLEMIERFNRPVATGETIIESEWFTQNASGEAVRVSSASGVQLAFVTFAGTDRPDSSNTQEDPIEGLGSPTEISTGGVTGLRGDYRADVNNVGFDDGQSFTQDQALQTNANGRLTPQTGSNPIVAFVELPISADNRLFYQTT